MAVLLTNSCIHNPRIAESSVQHYVGMNSGDEMDDEDYSLFMLAKAKEKHNEPDANSTRLRKRFCSVEVQSGDSMQSLRKKRKFDIEVKQKITTSFALSDTNANTFLRTFEALGQNFFETNLKRIPCERKVMPPPVQRPVLPFPTSSHLSTLGSMPSNLSGTSTGAHRRVKLDNCLPSRNTLMSWKHDLSIEEEAVVARRIATKKLDDIVII